AFDDRLDRIGDPAQQLSKLGLPQLLGSLAQRLRLGEPGWAALRPADWARLVRLLIDGLVVDLLDALRQVEPGKLVEAPPRTLVQPRAAGADRQHPEPAGGVDQRQQRPDAEMIADRQLLGDLDRQLVNAVKARRQKHAEPAVPVAPE